MLHASAKKHRGLDRKNCLPLLPFNKYPKEITVLASASFTSLNKSHK
jgi:hypothetical protein